jgi:two-component system response regulator
MPLQSWARELRRVDTLPPPSRVHVTHTPRPVILLVDDNDDDVELTSRALRNAGITAPIVVRMDADSALDWLRVTAMVGRQLPALVLMDVQLPGSDGFTAVQQLRMAASTACLPVILLTGCTRDEAGFYVGNFESLGFLRKPLDRERFESTVADLGVAVAGLRG